MIHVKSGDRIICRVKDGIIVSCFSEFDSENIFEVIASYEDDYFVYTPEYYNIKQSFLITTKSITEHHINKRFVNGYMNHINTNDICRIYSVINGCVCQNCNEFFQDAEPNASDNLFVCFLCRTYWR